MKMGKIVGLFIVLSLVMLSLQAKGEKMTIQEGKEVSFDYRLTVDGNVVDSSKQNGPMEYVHGQGKIIPGLSKELEGMTAGEQKSVDIPPSQAYGPINKEAVQQVPKSKLPENINPQEGMYLQVQSQGGQAMPVRIAEVKDESIVLDLNHPLAGKTLHFDVEINSVK